MLQARRCPPMMGITIVIDKFLRWRERPARATLSILKIIIFTSETLALATEIASSHSYRNRNDGY
jgi:hypothetical protein